MIIAIRAPKTDADFASLSDLAQQLARYHQEDLHPNPTKLMADAGWYSARLVSVDGADVGFVGWHKCKRRCESVPEKRRDRPAAAAQKCTA